MRIIPISAAALLILGIAGCSSAASPASPAIDDDRPCIDVPAEIMQRIADGANSQPITPTTAGAVRSESFSDATIVAMSFDIDGENETGVWAVGGTFDDPGSTLSIDAMAATVTDWPNEMNGESFDITEDGAAEALACIA